MANEMNNYGFARHPGKILERELNARGMTHAELALRAGTSAKNVSEIIAGKAPISPDMAIKLEYALGTPAHVWNSLQMNYQEALLRDKAKEYQAAEEEHAKQINYANLRKINSSLPDVRKLSERIEALRRMFGVSSLATIFDTDSSSRYFACAMRSNAVTIGKSPDRYALISWLRVGEINASRIACPEYDARQLKKCLPEIKKLIYEKQIPEAWTNIGKLLFSCGVKLVSVPYLSNTYVNGAVRWIGDNPVIIMSDRNGFADIFWFSLIHEICHIIKHGKKYACLAFEDSVKCFDKPIEETEADEFAAEFFIDKAEYEAFTADFTRNDYSSAQRFAKKNQIPVYIIIGRLAHDGLFGWDQPGAHDRPRVKIAAASI